MGLDIVELVMRVEEEFGIEIPDEEAEQATTVGKLHETILRKLDLGDTKACVTSIAFYRTRRALVEILGVSRKSIRPTTTLDELFPETARANHWRAFRRSSELRTPELATGWFLRGNVFPVGNVGDLAKRIAALNGSRLKAECGGWTENEVWGKLKQIVSDELGLDIEKIIAEAKFVDDLGAD